MKVYYELAGLHQGFLKRALGDRYESIKNLYDVVQDYHRAPSGLPRKPLQDMRNATVSNSSTAQHAHVIGARAGMKRKAEVIDLTDG